MLIWNFSRSRWLRGLRRASAVARLTGLPHRIPPEAWTSVSCGCCVLWGRGLCVRLIIRPEESCRVWCVWVWSPNLNNEEARAVEPLKKMEFLSTEFRRRYVGVWLCVARCILFVLRLDFNLTFIAPCTARCVFYNQRDAIYIMFFIIINVLHVSGGPSAHHQEPKKLYVQRWVLSCFPAVYRWCG